MILPVSYATILDDPNWPTLLKEYSAECSLPEIGVASPQRDLYGLLQKSGCFQAFAVYESDLMVGFAAVLIYVLPHYGVKVASTESIFVTKSCNRGIELRDAIKRYAIKNGCVKFLYSAPVGSRFDKVLSATIPHTNNVYIETL